MQNWGRFRSMLNKFWLIKTSLKPKVNNKFYLKNFSEYPIGKICLDNMRIFIAIFMAC